MNNDKNRATLARLMDQAYLEVIPTPTILERLTHIPRQSYVSITCSPVKGLEPTLKLTEQLRALPRERQLKLIPHIAARMIRDRGHLSEILARLHDARVESVFVPAGDAAEPVGKYVDSLQVLKDMAEIGHDIEDVGVAAYPEGHPLVPEPELRRFLKEKQPFATYMVTQMCFDSGVIINWLKSMHAAGIRLPAWVGLPGVANKAQLVSLSLRIGVGQSLRMIRKQNGLIKRMFSTRPYQPDDLLEGLKPHLHDPAINIPGFHLFCFNEVERTENWRAQTARRLKR